MSYFTQPLEPTTNTPNFTPSSSWTLSSISNSNAHWCQTPCCFPLLHSCCSALLLNSGLLPSIPDQLTSPVSTRPLWLDITETMSSEVHNLFSSNWPSHAPLQRRLRSHLAFCVPGSCCNHPRVMISDFQWTLEGKDYVGLLTVVSRDHRTPLIYGL